MFLWPSPLPPTAHVMSTVTLPPSPNSTTDFGALNVTENHSVTARHPDSHSVNWGVVSLSLIIVATAIGNVLVCLAVCWEKRLQNMTNYFLMSLAIADLLVSVLVMPLGMVVELYGYFPLDPSMCVMWATMDVLMCTASIWHMSTMSMDRYFTLKYPMRYGRNKTRKMVAVKITFVWVISVAISCPVCILGFLDYNNVYNNGMCVPTIREFIIYGSIFAFYVPLAIMVFTYVLTIKILCDNQKLMQSIVREHSSKARYRKERNGAYSTTYLTPNMYAPRFMDRPSLDTSISCGTSINEISFPSNNDTLGDTKTNIHSSSSPPVSSQCSNTSPRKVSHDPIPEFVCAVQAPSPCLSASASPLRLSASFQEYLGNSNRDDSTAANSSHASPVQSIHSWHDEETASKHSLKNSIEERLNQIGEEMDAFLQLQPEQGHTEASDIESIPDDCNLPEEIAETCSLMKDEHEASSHSNHSTPSHTSDEGPTRPKTLMVPPVTVTSPQLTSSEDGNDDSDDSDNDSDLITIHLKATGCYMYRLDPRKSGLLGNSHHLKSPSASHSELEQDCQTDKDTHDESARSLSNDRVYSPTYSQNSPHVLSTAYQNGWKNLRQSFRRKRCKSNGEIANMIPKRTASNEKKASKVLGIIFAVFVVLWTPFFIMNIIAVTCSPCLEAVTPSMMASIVWLGYLSSLANPIIYTMFNTAFRHAFYKILTCSYKKSMMPSSTPDTMFLTATNHWATDNRRNTVTLTLRDTIN